MIEQAQGNLLQADVDALVNTVNTVGVMGHWKAASRLADIERGLDDLVSIIRREGIQPIAVPPLGCGNGGLDRTVVEPLIRAKLASLEDVPVLLHPPDGAPGAP